MLTEISGVEEPPTDFTDAHRWLGCVGFSYGIHRIHSKLGCVRGALGTAWVRQDAIPSYICVNPCYLWKDTVCFVGAAETAAPPELASVEGYFMNVGAWVWQGCHTLLQDFCAFRAFCGRIPFALLVQQRLLHPPPELASVGGNFKNVGAWVWQDAIPSYDATPRGARQ